MLDPHAAHADPTGELGEGKLGTQGCEGVEELEGGIMGGRGGFLLMDALLGAPVVL